MTGRTDLALEAREVWRDSRDSREIPGIKTREYVRNGFAVTEVRVLDERGSRALGKPEGTYVTVDLDKLLRREDEAFPRCARVIADVIAEMLPENANSALVAGLGNTLMTPDSLGPLTLRNIMVTRHLVSRYPEQFASFRCVSAVEPGVLGATGTESATVVQAVAEKISPDAVLVIDALASRSMSRVCRTVQISDTGIIPGSGVGNSREAISAKALGVPVIAIGVPTVVDAATLALDIAAESGAGELDENALRRHGSDMIVTPRDIDESVRNTARLLGYAVNLALHPGITVEDADAFLS